MMAHKPPLSNGILDSRGRQTPLALVIEWGSDSESLRVVCPYCLGCHRHGLGRSPLTGQTRAAHCGLSSGDYQLCYPFEEQSQAQYSYRIDRARGLFVTVGVSLPNDDEDEESEDEENEKVDEEDEGEEAEEVNRDFRSLQAERDDSNRDQLQNLEDQAARLSIGDAETLEPPSFNKIWGELMQDAHYRQSLFTKRAYEPVIGAEETASSSSNEPKRGHFFTTTTGWGTQISFYEQIIAYDVPDRHKAVARLDRGRLFPVVSAASGWRTDFAVEHVLDNRLWRDRVLELCQLIGYALPEDHRDEPRRPGSFNASHAEKKLVAYYINQHVILPSVLFGGVAVDQPGEWMQQDLKLQHLATLSPRIPIVRASIRVSRATSFASNCELAAATYNVDFEEFGLWNPGLGNVSDPACAFEKGVRYCGSWYLEAGNEGSPTDASPTPPGPTMSGSPADCNEWAIVTDGLSCTDLASEAGISLEQFLAWNPAVSSDCKTNYWVDEAYCVGISGDDGDDGSATTTSTASPTTSKPTPPGPTMTGSPADCNKWSLVTDGLSCTDLATQAGISLAQFLAWNPAVSSDCKTNYWLGEAYCVGVSGDATTTKSPTTSAAPTSSKPTPPGPTMTGSPADCNKWSLVTDGLSCTDLATQAGISLAQFLAWNPAVSSDCSTNYWLGEAYCVGVAGGSTPTTTKPTTTAKPTSTKPTPPGPTMSGSPANCNKWSLVTDGLTCTALASQAGITLKQFLAWNPAVSSDCVTNYWLGEAYCVGVSA